MKLIERSLCGHFSVRPQFSWKELAAQKALWSLLNDSASIYKHFNSAFVAHGQHSFHDGVVQQCGCLPQWLPSTVTPTWTVIQASTWRFPSSVVLFNRDSCFFEVNLRFIWPERISFRSGNRIIKICLSEKSWISIQWTHTAGSVSAALFCRISQQCYGIGNHSKRSLAAPIDFKHGQCGLDWMVARNLWLISQCHPLGA